jgi:hypothetical protein
MGRIFVAGQTGNGKLYMINPAQPAGACSDGLNFWIAFRNADKLARF